MFTERVPSFRQSPLKVTTPSKRARLSKADDTDCES